MADTASLDALWRSMGNSGDRPVGWFGPGGSADRPNYTGSSTSSLDPQAAIDMAIKRQQEAVKPAIESYQAQQPEITAKYTQTRSQLQSKEEPLKQRYQTLLESIKGNQQTAENRQTVATQNELGKRRISGSSGVAQQEMTNALNPITQQYATLTKDTSLSQENDLTALRDQIANLTPQETADQRAITQAIANLQAGAGQTGIGQGLQLYSQNIEQQLAQQEAQRQSQQQAIENAIAQAQLQNETDKTQYAINAPYFKPETGSSGIGDIFSLLGGVANSNSFTPSTPKPTAYPIQQMADGRIRFSDGSIR